MPNLYFGNDSDLILDGMRLAADNSVINDAVLTAQFFDSSTDKAITGATNASPIVVTCVGHGHTTGDQVVIAHVLGNTAANGRFTITVTGANTFSLNGSTGNGSYIRGGNCYPAITGGTDISLDYQSGSNGKYVGVVQSSINLLPTESARCIVFCSNYDFQIERDHTCQIRT